MEPSTDKNVTNGAADTVSSDDTITMAANGAMTTNGFQPFGNEASSTTDLSMSQSLEDLQNDEQRRVLDTVSKVRKCGLDSVLSLPQIVVCGDQSSGKSSVLEALTEIPFPSLRRHPTSSLTIKIIPSDARSKTEQKKVRRFSLCITDFKELPTIMENVTEVMGITDSSGPFARDILSIEIQGPDRPQLTLVDIPGLIQSSTKGVSKADVAMVAEITKHYIEQHRTVCLAVVSATNDAANQPILQQAREVDPKGERTLGVITKPDLLSAGSGSEASFLELARNENVVFNLGWHVIKNRKFEEKDFSIKERNVSESEFFKTSNFKTLPEENVGIDSLRVKLSQLLFEHVKNELPRLQDDLETTLKMAGNELKLLGEPRSTAIECRSFLGDMTMKFYELCKAGVNGHYEHDWFKDSNKRIVKCEKIPRERIRAIVQGANNDFANEMREKGHKYQVDKYIAASNETAKGPKRVTEEDALKWVKEALQRSRGTELLGNFNCNVVAELFWEQSEAWEEISKKHVDNVSADCKLFVHLLLDYIAPDNIKQRIWSSTVLPALENHRREALNELDKLLVDRKSSPINYNHYYTDTIHKKRWGRIEHQLEKHMPADLTLDRWSGMSAGKVIRATIHNWANSATGDMEGFSCEEALDCLLAIYKVQQKTFIANVATQVIERHIVRNLDRIFSPKFALSLTDTQAENMVSEPKTTKRERLNLKDKIRRLQEGNEIFRDVIGM